MELAVYPDRAFFSVNIEDINVLEKLNFSVFLNKLKFYQLYFYDLFLARFFIK